MEINENKRMKKKQIGYIGLGNMGMPMATNILQAGYDLMAYDIQKKAMDNIVSKGAVAAASIAELALSCDIVITILPKDQHILQVYSGPEGLILNAKDDLICIEMTSARGETVQHLAQLAGEAGKKISFLDAPVSGGIPGAESGTLTVMAGGEKELFEQCRPILELMCKKIFFTGELGSGKIVKMINQLLNAGNTYIAAESLFLAERLGVDLDLLCTVVKESSGNSWVFENNISKFMLAEKYDTGFRLDLLKKDISLSMEQALKDDISLPVSSQIYQIYQAMENQGNGSQNYNIVKKWVEQQNKKEDELNV